ncbi:hypothetical protein D3C76_1177630 [compost metagenome]
MTIDGVDGVIGAVDRGVRDAGHQLGQGTGVIFFSMVNDDVVDIGQVNFTAQVLHELTAEFMIDGVDQHVFFFPDEIAVIAAAAQRFVFRSVKITYFPVTLTNPMNIVFNQNRHSNLNLIQRN